MDTVLFSRSAPATRMTMFTTSSATSLELSSRYRRSKLTLMSKMMENDHER